MGLKKGSAGSDRHPVRKTTLRNGVRVVSEWLPSVRSIALGVWVGAGSRYEKPEESGLSHFIEHLVFKGTKRRDARQIAQALESLGGSLNAFTSREHTCYIARVLDEHLPQAVDVLADIVCHATFTPTNMNRERLVICEEIKESLDSPADYIHDIFARAFWGEHPLGQPIMGFQETVMSIPRRTLRAFIDRHYRARSVVIAASGSISHDRLVKLVRDHFSFDAGASEPPLPANRINADRVVIKPDDNSQTQFCLGFPGLAYRDLRKMGMMVMTSYLGGGMSSVLFQKIREQRGLAYSVYSFHDFFQDFGVFGVYLGTDRSHLEQAYDVIMTECRRLKRRKMSASDLHQVKAQIKGNLTLGMESTVNRMNRLGRMEMMIGQYVPLEATMEAVDKVTAAEIAELANLVFDDDRITLAVLGPVEENTFAGI